MPSSFLSAGQVAVTALFAELSGLAAVTSPRPGGGSAQTAYAVTVQLSTVPFSSSRPCAVTLVSALLGRTSPSVTSPKTPVSWPAAPPTRLPPGQVAVALLFDELTGLVYVIRSVPVTARDALPPRLAMRVASASAITKLERAPILMSRRGIESPDAAQIVGLQRAQGEVVVDGRPHHRPRDVAVVQAQQVTQLVQRDALDVESTRDRSVDPRLAVVEVQRLRITARHRPAARRVVGVSHDVARHARVWIRLRSPLDADVGVDSDVAPRDDIERQPDTGAGPRVQRSADRVDGDPLTDVGRDRRGPGPPELVREAAAIPRAHRLEVDERTTEQIRHATAGSRHEVAGGGVQHPGRSDVVAHLEVGQR